VTALNAYDGQILIFDGHGADNATEPVGKLVIGNDLIDVWELRNKVRIPAIVILSACDTHGIDALSHATVGNGFLFLGARTVLATLLPVNGFQSASFVARLIYRLADFIPAALSSRKRVLNWTEIISGMLRMTFASEVLDELIGPPDREGSPRARKATAESCLRPPGWFCSRALTHSVRFAFSRENCNHHRCGVASIFAVLRLAGTATRTDGVSQLRSGKLQ
jgi:CHAT domain